jgi:hypothetical protein
VEGQARKHEAIPTTAQREGSSSKQKENGQKPPMQVTPAPLLRKKNGKPSRTTRRKGKITPHS